VSRWLILAGVGVLALLLAGATANGFLVGLGVTLTAGSAGMSSRYLFFPGK
jgi:hypothetical protein